MQWIDTIMSDPDDRPRDSSDLINRIYRMKAST
jgi:hypothetical protein